MNDTLQKFIKKSLKTLKDNWIVTLIILVVTADLTHQYLAMKTYKQDPDVLLYEKLNYIIISSDNNSSVESMQITDLLSQIDKSTKVYMIKEANDKLSVLAQESNRTMIAKHIPLLSMTFTLEPKLLEKHIDYEWVEKKERPHPLLLKVINEKFLNLLLLVGLLYVLMYTTGVTFFQKEFHAIHPKEIEGDFSDLVGYEEIKTEAKQLQYIMTQKEQYARYGIDGTFNILFSGKAGTGKSKFALYLAKELNVPIVSSTGNLDEMYVGTGAKKIRNLFKEAHALAKNSEHNACILFIDEGQNLLRTRGHNSDNKWEDDTANELLAHLDGVQKNSKHHIIVIIASNFDEKSFEMDGAMLRRFKKKIHFREPNIEERKAILTHYLQKVEHKAKNIDITYLAKNMSGMTPAIIESVVQEAGLMALRSESVVDTDVLLKAFERMVLGQSSRGIIEGEREEQIRRAITVHEIGHFLVEYHRAMLASEGNIDKAKELTRIMKISSESIDQIGALGFAMREQDDGMMLKSVEDMEWEIKQLYGGIAAEQMVFGKNGHTTGGSDDIKKATKYLQHLIVENAVYSTSKLNYEILGAKESQIEMIEEKSKAFYEESMCIVQEYELLLLYLSRVLMAEWSLTKEEIFESIKEFKT